MRIIKGVRIKYFRSIHTTTRGSVTHLQMNDINVFVGQNDAGKSNVLRALNLFFNGECEPGQPFSFFKDFSVQRHKKRREKSRIEIELTIEPPKKLGLVNNGYINWSKTWLENNQIDESFEYLNGDSFIANRKSGFYKWLKKIKFRYVPAIKSQEYFNRLMYDLYVLFQKDTNELEEVFNNQVRQKTSQISEELNKRLNMSSVLQFKGTFRELFNTLEFGTEDGKIMLTQRGDGIKIRHIPVILQNMAEVELSENRRREPAASTIIAFEEPENNLEFKFERRLAQTFIDYAKRIHYKDNKTHPLDEGVQLFITTHSPVFYTLQDQSPDLVNTFYVGKKSDESSDIKPIPKNDRGRQEIEREMDLDPLIELSSKWNLLTREYQKITSDLSKLKEKLADVDMPVLITEGKTDVNIIRTAWIKLFPEKHMPFKIITGNTHNNEESYGGNAGAGVLHHFLKSVKPEDNKTIALWDRDEAGIKAFKLDKNFDKNQEKEFLKTHKNNKAFGIILPIPEDRKLYAKAENLAIEYYFNPEEIEQKNEHGSGITLQKQKISRKFGDILEEQELDNEELKIITGNKVVFAEEIVATLQKASFHRFNKLFETIEEILYT